MSKIIDAIVDAKRSKSYIKYNKYHKNNIFGITRLSRWELMHSSFIGWLLDDSSCITSNHFQMYKFILMVYRARNSSLNNDARLDKDIILKFLDENFIEQVDIEIEYSNIDILIEVKTKEKILPIIIENKVNSKENGRNGDQTTTYFNLAENKYSDENLFFKPVYIFLAPAFNKTIPNQKEYIHVSYQELVDYVIEPVMELSNDAIIKENIKNYLQCLSFQTDYEKGEKIMALSSEERKIIEEFKKENKNLIMAVIESMEDIPDDVKDNFNTQIRDNTTYEFNGIKDLGKGRLVLEVVKKYVQDHNPNFEELQSVFKKDLIGGGKAVVKLENEVSNKDKGIGERGHKRYFVADPIELNKNGIGERVLVCTEWGIGNIGNFVKFCRNSLHYDINENKD